MKRDRLLRKVHWQDFLFRIQFFWCVTPRHCAASCLGSETTRRGIQTNGILVATAAKNTKLAQEKTALFWFVNLLAPELFFLAHLYIKCE
jgi:hypothetical protein